MEPNQTGAVSPKMPGQVITAVVLLWISTAAGILLTIVGWADYSARIDHGQDAGFEQVMAILYTVIAAVTLAVVIGLHLRRDLARTVGLVLAAVSAILALFGFVTTFNLTMILNLAMSGVLFGMLVSEPANGWCDR
jgi:hypothetical protein